MSHKAVTSQQRDWSVLLVVINYDVLGTTSKWQYQRDPFPLQSFVVVC